MSPLMLHQALLVQHRQWHLATPPPSTATETTTSPRFSRLGLGILMDRPLQPYHCSTLSGKTKLPPMPLSSSTLTVSLPVPPSLQFCQRPTRLHVLRSKNPPISRPAFARPSMQGCSICSTRTARGQVVLLSVLAGVPGRHPCSATTFLSH